MEADLKLSHLRILIAILLRLQEHIRYSYFKQGKPPSLLPGPLIQGRKTRIVEIYVADCHMENNNHYLRARLDEMRKLNCTAPGSVQFPCVIAGFSYPKYSKTIRVVLLEDFISSILHRDEGYFYFDLNFALTIDNRYTLRLYWLICSWRNNGGFVLKLQELKGILAYPDSYGRLDNLESKILKVAGDFLKENGEIWFQFRRYEKPAGVLYAFKIKINYTPEQIELMRREKYDYCYRVLVSLGATVSTIDQIFKCVENEELEIFADKVAEIKEYMLQADDIKDKDKYILASLRFWADNWLEKYGYNDDEESRY